MATADASLTTFPPRTHQITCAEYHPDRGGCEPAELPRARRAHYECQQCDTRWLDNVGPVERPQCGCRYALWLNR